jgi:DNA-binding response OmpR family regulator
MRRRRLDVTQHVIVNRREESNAARRKRKRNVPVKEGPTVLLVEDDPDMREMLASVLRAEGYGVVEAADGDDALEWLGDGVLDGEPSRLPAAIVSDICLPYFSGLDILEGVQLAPRRLPVILITGFGDAETHARARELGAVCVLDKPFAMEDLRSAVRAALRPGGLRPAWARDGHEV